MFFRLLVSAGLVGFGYLIGREAGRAQAIREHLGSSDNQRRIRGETFDTNDYTVLDDSQATATRGKASGAKKPGQRQ
jgi:hypothetical protein